jgi:hypothetical protein
MPRFGLQLLRERKEYITCIPRKEQKAFVVKSEERATGP